MDDQRIIPDSEDQFACGQGAMDQQLEGKNQGNAGGQLLQTTAEDAPCLLVSKAALPRLKGLEGVKIEVVRGVRPLNGFGGDAEQLQGRIREEARRRRKDREAAHRLAKEAVKNDVDTFVLKQPIRGKEDAAALLENVGKRRRLESNNTQGGEPESSSKIASLFGANWQASEGGGLAEDGAKGSGLSKDKGLLDSKSQGPQKLLDKEEVKGEATQVQERNPFGVQQPEFMVKAGPFKALLGGAVNAGGSSQGHLGRKRSSCKVERGELNSTLQLRDCAEVEQVHRLRMEALCACSTKGRRVERSEGKKLIKKEVSAGPEKVGLGREEQGNQKAGEREDKALENMVPVIRDCVKRATAGLEIANERHERRRVAAEAAERRAKAAEQKAGGLECGAKGLPVGGLEASSDEDLPLGRKRSKVLRDKIRKRSLLGDFEIAGSKEAFLPDDAGLPLGSPGLARLERVPSEELAAAKLLLDFGGVGLQADREAGAASKNGSAGIKSFVGGPTQEQWGEKAGPLLADKKKWPEKGDLDVRLSLQRESQLQEGGQETAEEEGAIELSGREALALQSLRARGLLESDSTVRTRKPLLQRPASPLLEEGAHMGAPSLAKSVLGGSIVKRESKVSNSAGLFSAECSLGVHGEGVTGNRKGALERNGKVFDFDCEKRRKRRREDQGRLQLEAEEDLGFELLDFGKEVGIRRPTQLQNDIMLRSQEPEALVLPSQSRSKTDSLFRSQIRGDFSYEVVGFVSKIGGWALYLVAGACATRGETKLSDVRPVCCQSRRHFLEARAAVDYQAKSICGLELTQLTETRLRKQAWKASRNGEVYVVRRLAGRRMKDSEQAALGRACKLLQDSEGGGESQGMEAPLIAEDPEGGAAEAEERCPPNELEVIYEMPHDKCRPRFQRFPKDALLQATAFAVRVEKWLHDPRCSICQDDIESVSVLCQTEQCGHVFHRGCLLNWLESSNSCPTCRTRIPTFEGAAIAHKDLRASFDDGLPGDEFDDIMCEVCSLDECAEEAGNFILICDNCNKGYHLWCIALAEVPDGDWYCAPCQATFLAACALLEQPRLAPQNAQRQNRRAAQRRAPPPTRLSPRLANRGGGGFAPFNLQEWSSEREDGRGISSPDLGEDGLSPARRSSRLANRRVSTNPGLRSPLSEGGLLEGRRQRRLAAVRFDTDGGVLRGLGIRFSNEFGQRNHRVQQQEEVGFGGFFERGESSRPAMSEHDELLPASPEPRKARRRIGLPVFGPQPPKPCEACKKNKKGGMHCLRKHGELGGPEEQGGASG